VDTKKKEGLIRVNVDVDRSLHRKFKSKLSSQGETLNSAFLSFMEGFVAGDELPSVIPEDRNPGAEISLLDKRVNELLEMKLSSLGVKAEADFLGKKVEVVKDPEDKIYHTKKPVEKPVPPLQEYSVEPVVPPEALVDGKDVKLQEVKEKISVVEDGMIIENGIVAKRILMGKRLTIAEVEKRTFFDWFIDGGHYAVIAEEEKEVEAEEEE
jgi:hypothetical protein